MIDLNDVTFNIPVRIDFPERLENVQIIVEYLTKNFNTNVHLWEDGPIQMFQPPAGIKYTFTQNTSPFFYKTRLLNKMLKMCDTEIIVNPYDCDVILPVDRYLDTAEMIRQDKADAVYPYNGMFVNIGRHNIPSIIEHNGPDHLTEWFVISNDSCGGCLFWKRSKLIEIGMQNERFLSWGAEDYEVLHRAKSLGIRVERMPGFIYHMDHRRGINSGHTNPFFNANELEWHRVMDMTPDDLRIEVTTWPWCQTQ